MFGTLNFNKEFVKWYSDEDHNMGLELHGL